MRGRSSRERARRLYSLSTLTRATGPRARALQVLKWFSAAIEWRQPAAGMSLELPYDACAARIRTIWGTFSSGRPTALTVGVYTVSAGRSAGKPCGREVRWCAVPRLCRRYWAVVKMYMGRSWPCFLCLSVYTFGSTAFGAISVGCMSWGRGNLVPWHSNAT